MAVGSAGRDCRWTSETTMGGKVSDLDEDKEEEETYGSWRRVRGGRRPLQLAVKDRSDCGWVEESRSHGPKLGPVASAQTQPRFHSHSQRHCSAPSSHVAPRLSPLRSLAPPLLLRRCSHFAHCSVFAFIQATSITARTPSHLMAKRQYHHDATLSDIHR